MSKTNESVLGRNSESCIVSVTSSKKNTKCRAFHFRYLELCRSKNLTPASDIRGKNNVTTLLEFLGDKLGVNEWLLIIESLYYDQVLQTISIRLRKNNGFVIDHMDTEKKAKMFRQKPAIYTKYVFSGFVEAISNCIQFNKNLRVLNLEGLPLSDKYVESVAKAISANESLKELSFKRSQIYDKGCEAICNTVKYLNNIEKINLSECQITEKGAIHVANMIKIQKISRYTEGWQQSLRYRDVDPDSMAGLKGISLAGNVQIGDEGLKHITEILKEDVWIKVLDMENCGLTDIGANLILDCLEINTYIIDINIRGNPGVSKFLARNIRDHLGKGEDEQRLVDGQPAQTGAGDASGTNQGPQKIKFTLRQLREQLKTLEQQLAFERVLRQKAEELNERLNQQIVSYESQMQEEASNRVPEGYVVISNDSLMTIIKERNDFQKMASETDNTKINCEMSAPVLCTDIEQHYNSYTTDNTTTNDSTARSLTRQAPAEQRNIELVRKVKSEMKYVEPKPKNSQRKNSKSDHEFANEKDFKLTSVRFERNIGDGPNAHEFLSNRVINTKPNINNEQNTIYNNYNNIMSAQPFKTNYNNSNNEKKVEMEDLHLSSRSDTSIEDDSSESATLRNMSDDYQPIKVVIRQATAQQSQNTTLFEEDTPKESLYEQKKLAKNSARALFLGLCQ